MRADVQIKVGPREPVRRKGRVIGRPVNDNYSVDVKKGKFVFDLGESNAKVTIQDADADDRHILINVQRVVTNERPGRKGGITISTSILNDKWLCGHDERDWFVAAATGTSIAEAKQNLKPEEVRVVEMKVSKKKRNKRKNEAFLRQGEWFFVPATAKEVPATPVIHKDEPMSRPGGGKPHIVEEVFRTGGKAVWADSQSRVISDKEYAELSSIQKSRYSQRQANANVYCRGYVKHPDHTTIILVGWHKILMNTENRNRSGATMVFLD